MTILNEKVKEIIKEIIVGADETTDKKEELFFEDDQPLVSVGMDSMNFISLLVAIESEFGIEFEDEELNMDNFETVNMIVGLLGEKVKNE